ncbi:hypothetical protein CH333_10150 [candidate division WOR-3 bacterium JGI_Cruoil_03_44_89]|uniref:Uncharacterized protein n=1 Tax=candidate division WOR-3 bacterium JGI_Cruoil_03_44_89 TaxID=1973748 RepID=A0A235BP12_UNCW3|nr:MAG: hypothetical protein CH333_10150 [candidate division WOR-3 bacterium JGI_Cruoil_03_44_89]
MKKLGWIIVVVIVGAVVFRIVQHFKTGESVKSVTEVATEVLIEEVKMGDIAQTLSYTGNIEGQEQVTVYPIEETGRLIKYLVKEGGIVKKGQVIALVDRSIKGMEFRPAKITSPLSGTVGMLFLDRGAMVAPQIPIAMIADINKVKIKIQIVERDISKVHKGQSAVITVDAYPDKKFQGKLLQISSFVNPMTKTAEGEIIVPNQGHILKPGMFARVELIVDKHKGVLVVPNKAVLKQEGKEIVFVDAGNIAKLKEVETGFEDENRTEIISGLELGEPVIVLGNYGLRDSGRIKIKE